MSDRKDKDVRLAKKRDIGERMRVFVEDPDIKAWFDDAKARQVQAMLAAAPCDDEKRRAAALQINAIEALWGFLRRAATEGQQAANEIDKRSKRPERTAPL
jgi:hypothetical protein